MSRFEKRFGVKRRGKGRPVGMGRESVVFSMRGKDLELAKQAKQRTLALMIDENREYMRQVFEDEYAHLSGSRSAAGAALGNGVRRRRRRG